MRVERGDGGAVPVREARAASTREGRGGPAPKLRRRNEREGEAARPGSRSAATSRPGHLTAVASRLTSACRGARTGPRDPGLVGRGWLRARPHVLADRTGGARALLPQHVQESLSRSEVQNAHACGSRTSTTRSACGCSGSRVLISRVKCGHAHTTKRIPTRPRRVPSRVMICCVSRQWWSLEL